MASSDGNSETVPHSELIDIQNPLGSRLLVTFQSFDRRELIGISLIISGIAFAVSGAIAFLAGFGSSFLRTGSVYIWTAGLFGAALTAGWWAKRYPELWTNLSPVFDASDNEYQAVVRPRIATIYNIKRTLLWLSIFLVVGVLYDLEVGVYMIIRVVEVSHLTFQTFLALNIINWTFGIVSLFGLVLGVRVVFHHLRLVSELMEFRLRNIQAAAAELKPLARFNVVISAGWFITLSLATLLLRVSPLYDFNFLLQSPWSRPAISSSFFILVLLGFVLFAVPQYLIHTGIKAEKQTLLADMQGQYKELHEEVSPSNDATNTVDQVSVRLEVLDARRRNIKESRTWAYDLPGVLSLIATSVVPIISLIVTSSPSS